MSIEATLHLALIGLVVFVVVISFALDEKSYGGHRYSSKEPDNTSTS